MVYIVPKPNEAVLISGGLSGDKFRVVTGKGAFFIPLFQQVHKFYIGAHSVRVNVDSQTKQNIEVDVQSTVVFRVSPVHSSISEAASRFLGMDTIEMQRIASDIFSGKTRAIIGGMSVEEIISDREKLNEAVLLAAGPEMSQIGLQVDNFQINEISDRNNHIANLSQPELARVEQIAKTSQAVAESEVEKARQEAERQKSLYRKETDLQVSKNTMETAESRAEAAQSGPLAEAEARIKVAEKESELAVSQAKLKEAQLNVDIIKPAEAEARRVKIQADADAEAMKVKSESLAAHDRITLDQQVIEQLPEIITAYAEPLAKSNLTIFNGAEGYNDVLSQLMNVVSHLSKNTDILQKNEGVIDNPR